jgi:hypothetical protein
MSSIAKGGQGHGTARTLIFNGFPPLRARAQATFANGEAVLDFDARLYATFV